MAVERTSEFSDFQAEYEGSIPFTRSSLLNKCRPMAAAARLRLIEKRQDCSLNPVGIHEA
jgi:hypothetical protein